MALVTAIRHLISHSNLSNNIELTKSDNTLVATPIPEPLYGGQILCEMEIPHNPIIPVVYKDEIIGYRCSFSQIFAEIDNSGNASYREAQSPVDHFYINKVEDMIFQAGNVTPTADDRLNYFELHTVSTIKDSFETEEYLFLYMFSSYVMNGTDRLIKINKADGTKIEYQDMLGCENHKRFENVIIDEENKKVYFGYNEGYAVDLKTDEIRISRLIETETKVDIQGESPISYLYVEKVLINGTESEITYPYISGHFDRTHSGRAEAKPYVYNGKVYINASFITHLFEENNN